MNAKRFLGLAILFTVTSGRLSADLLSPDRSISEVIDHYIDERLIEANVRPALEAADVTLIRRLTLDLAGRIPTTRESLDYIESKYPSKRARLIDRLMSSPGYNRHGATELDTLLRAENEVAPSLKDYLLLAVRERRPWNQMFAEMLGVSDDEHTAGRFISGRLANRDGLTRDLSSVFFGINLSCCQCHDHPYVGNLTQDYFFGLKAFFHRSYEFQGRLFDKQFSDPLQFSSNDGEGQQANLIFLTGTTIDEPKTEVPDLKKAIESENNHIEELKKNFEKDKVFPAHPEFSPRSQLVDLALRDGERNLLARAIVNRLWYRFYGYGLVMRTDQMHSENSPSHPELLEWLTRDFTGHGYNLHRLVRGLVSSRTYSRSSNWLDGDPPPAELFAVADIRPLTPMQYGLSLRLASNPDALSQDVAQREQQLTKFENEAQKWFGKIIVPPHEGMQISVGESLQLSNNAELLRILGDGLVPKLLRSANRRELIETSVWSVLSRPPTEDDVQILDKFLASREPQDAERAQSLQRSLETLIAIDDGKTQVAQIDAEIVELIAQHREAAIRTVLAQTEKYLSAAAQFNASENDGEQDAAETLAQPNGLNTTLLRNWLQMLGLYNRGTIVRHFTERLSGVMAHPQLVGWGTLKTPNLLANASDQSVSFNYGEAYRNITLVSHGISVHPSPDQRVAIGWLSPIDGRIQLSGSITDIDPSRGNGVDWSLELRRSGYSRTVTAAVLENGTATSLDRVEDFEVERGDMLSVVIDARVGDHGCDTTQVDWTIEDLGENGNVWNLAEQAAGSICSNNPHIDAFGNLLVWHFYAVRDEELAIPSGSFLARWLELRDQVEPAAADTNRRQQIGDMARELQQLLSETTPPLPQDSPNSKLYEILTSHEGPLFQGMDFAALLGPDVNADLAKLHEERAAAIALSSQKIAPAEKVDVDRFRQGVEQMVWSLLTSSEFRFNY